MSNLFSFRLEALKMETICVSETLISTHESTRHHNPEEQHHLQRCENLKSHITIILPLICDMRTGYTSGMLSETFSGDIRSQEGHGLRPMPLFSGSFATLRGAY
jgi:hypothetical protein